MRKILFIIAAGICLIAFANGYLTQSRKLSLAESVISHFYVDSINEEELVENAIVGMLKELDPHSSYTNAKETKEMNEPLEGNFSGIGITFNMNLDTLYVIQTVNGGPSERVGIRAGDRIIAVNDTAIAGVKMRNTDIMKKLRGKKGTNVNLKVLRHNTGSPDQIIDFTVTRAEIPIHSIDVSYMATPEVGYVKINRFSATTHDEFMKAIKKLKAEGMKKLIIDLTDNGGGYLGTAVDMLGEILEPGSVAVRTEGLNSPRQEFKAQGATGTPALAGMPLVVLLNQYSASASEIMAGAIQDWDRGVIVGRRSFGKGLVQRPFPFPDGSMIKLTVAHYYTPSGRDIQKPYKKGASEDYALDILDRYKKGELMHADSIHFVDSLKVNTLKKHRVIYGGGGITPDKFVPLDTTEYSDYYRDVMAKGLINQYSIGYTDKNRKQLLKQYPTGTSFISNFNITDQMLKELCDMAEAEKIPFKQEEFDRSRKIFETAIKALIGRDVYDEEVFYRIWNARNEIMLEGLEIINSPEYNKILSN